MSHHIVSRRNHERYGTWSHFAVWVKVPTWKILADLYIYLLHNHSGLFSWVGWDFLCLKHLHTRRTHTKLCYRTPRVEPSRLSRKRMGAGHLVSCGSSWRFQMNRYATYMEGKLTKARSLASNLLLLRHLRLPERTPAGFGCSTASWRWALVCWPAGTISQVEFVSKQGTRLRLRYPQKRYLNQWISTSKIRC